MGARQDQAAITGVCSILTYGANISFDLQSASALELWLPFLVAHCSLLLLSALICFTVPRKPRVFQYGKPEKPVDRERVVSVLSRYTLSWANPLLSLAMGKGGLDLNDLPSLKASMTADALVVNFSRFRSSRLWKHILRAHASVFTQQWIFTVFWAIATLAPQYCLYRVIVILERDAVHPGVNASLWLVLLGLSQFIQPWIEAWVLWIGWCHIALPIYVQLSALIVEKTEKGCQGYWR